MVRGHRDHAAMTTLSPPRRISNSWFFSSDTDQEESEHRVDFMADRLYCTCAGWRARHYCKHVSYVRELMENSVTERHLIVQDHTPGADLPDVWRSPQDLARRLADLREERGLVHEFMKDVMIASRPGEADGDYGIIPGTDKPTLFKAGAEKLCELYGYGINIADIQETADEATGHYRVVVRVALIHKGSGVKVAEGIGECSTRESKYWKRWVFARDVPAGLDKDRLKKREGVSRQGNKYTQYEVENPDLHSLWNTVLKMGKKRALVDATLSATRSSGIFTQSAEHLDEWIDAEFEDITEPEAPPPAPAEPAVRASRGATRQGSTRPAEPAASPPEPDAIAGAIADYWARFLKAAPDVQRSVGVDVTKQHGWTIVDHEGSRLIAPVEAIKQGKGTPDERAALLQYLESCPL